MDSKRKASENLVVTQQQKRRHPMSVSYAPLDNSTKVEIVGASRSVLSLLLSSICIGVDRLCVEDSSRS